MSKSKQQDATARSSTSYTMLPVHNPSSNSPPNSEPSLQSRKHSNKRWKPSRFPSRTFAAISCLPLSLLPIVLLSAIAETASQSYLNGRDCYPNGMWAEAQGATWRIMDSSYFFTPNLSFGFMTFTQVKVIDIAWDLCVGRGGQLLLAWVNYRVFNEWLLYHMEMHRTSYKMSTSVAFQTTTLGTLGVLAKEWLAFGEKSWKRFFRWLALLCMVLGTLYVLAFPTLMAAMTGYITTYEPYIMDEGRNLVAWNEVRPVKYVILDSARLSDNYTKPLVVLDVDDAYVDAVQNYSSHYLGVSERWTTSLTNTVGEISIAGNSTSGTMDGIQRNISSTFVLNGTVIDLPAPSLKIRFGFPVPPRGRPSPKLMYPWYSLTPDLTTARQSPTFHATYVHSRGSCKPSETYQWGFSYIFLFMMSIFNFVWSCIMVGLWTDTRMHSRMYKAGRRPGLLRSILDTAAAMREEIGAEEGPNGDLLSEEELRRKLREGGGALVVPLGELRMVRDGGYADDASGEGDLRKRGWKRSLTKGSTF